MATSSVYSALCQEEAEIRLLELLPGLKNEVIQCRLSVVRLSKNPVYEALSYVWGDKNQTFEMVLNEQPFHGLESLRVCLRELRYESKSRTLWVDSFCINPDDVVERGQQVRLMGQIYRSAAKVVAWIGDSHELTTETMKCIHYCASRVRKDVPLDLQGGHRGKLRTLHRKAVLELVPFLECTWWSRIWTLQELLLSRELEFYWYKSGRLVRMPWKDLTDVARSAIDGDGIDMHDSSTTDDVTFYSKMATISAIELMDTCRYCSSSVATLTLADIMDLSRRRRSTDPRDKVYGLAGLVTDLSSICINYTMSVGKVYESCTVDSIRSSASLAALSNRRSFLRRHDLASWATDWIAEETYMHDESPYRTVQHSKTDPYYNTSSFAAAQVAYNGAGKLWCAGAVYDEIVEVFATAAGTMAEIRACTEKWYSDLCIELNQLYIAGGSRHDAFRRTICGDAMDDGYRLTNEYLTLMRSPCRTFDELTEKYDKQRQFRTAVQMPALRLFWQKERISHPGNDTARSLAALASDQMNQFDFRVISHCAEKCMFLTKKGYIGIAESGIRSGDHVAILLGAGYPFVLRVVDPDNARKQYTFHGTCYVHGIMDGEAVEQLNLLPQPYPFVVLV